MPLERSVRVEVVTSVHQRTRWTPEQILVMVNQARESGNSVLSVARDHDLTAAQMLQWGEA